MLNILKISIHDLDYLKGKFIIELNDTDHHPFDDLPKEFLMEKRISFISEIDDGYFLSGFYYAHSKILTPEDMVKKINDSKNNRHYRLLTPKELKKLCEFMVTDLMEL